MACFFLANNSPRLKCITVPVVDDQTCVETFPEYLYWGNMVCAGQNDTDNCLVSMALRRCNKGVFFLIGCIEIVLLCRLLCRVTQALWWCVMGSSRVWNGSTTAVETRLTLQSIPRCASTMDGSKAWWKTMLRLLQPHWRPH